MNFLKVSDFLETPCVIMCGGEVMLATIFYIEQSFWELLGREDTVAGRYEGEFEGWG